MVGRGIWNEGARAVFATRVRVYVCVQPLWETQTRFIWVQREENVWAPVDGQARRTLRGSQRTLCCTALFVSVRWFS